MPKRLVPPRRNRPSSLYEQVWMDGYLNGSASRNNPHHNRNDVGGTTRFGNDQRKIIEDKVTQLRTDNEALQSTMIDIDRRSIPDSDHIARALLFRQLKAMELKLAKFDYEREALLVMNRLPEEKHVLLQPWLVKVEEVQEYISATDVQINKLRSMKRNGTRARLLY
jgi:hypothetical protein